MLARALATSSAAWPTPSRAIRSVLAHDQMCRWQVWALVTTQPGAPIQTVKRIT